MSDYIKKYYEELHSEKNCDTDSNGHKISLTYNLRRKIISKMVDSIDFKEKVSILDSGCGNGYIYKDVIMPLLPKIDRSFGVDFVKDAVDIAKPIFDKVAVGNVLNLSSLTEAKYNFINSTEVFLYIQHEQREKYFKEHIDRLEKNGYFLITIPNLDSIYRKIFKPEKDLFPYHFNKDTILNLSKNFNVKLVRSCGIDVFKNIYRLDNNLKTFISFELSFLFQKT